jgi:hypothetical protein
MSKCFALGAGLLTLAVSSFSFADVTCRYQASERTRGASMGSLIAEGMLERRGKDRIRFSGSLEVNGSAISIFGVADDSTDNASAFLWSASDSTQDFVVHSPSIRVILRPGTQPTRQNVLSFETSKYKLIIDCDFTAPTN